MSPKERLVTWVEQQGISFVHHRLKTDYLSAIEEHQLAEAPFTSDIAVSWTDAAIHIDDSRGERPWAHLLHEAGHILWEKVRNPKKWQDIVFFGWEISVVNLLKLPMSEFYAANDGYGISFTDPKTDRFYDDISQMRLYSRPWRLFLQHYLEDGIQNGYVTKDGSPNHKPRCA